MDYFRANKDSITHYIIIGALLITCILLAVHINQMNKAENYATVVASKALFASKSIENPENDPIVLDKIQYTDDTVELVNILQGSPGIEVIKTQGGVSFIKSPFFGPIDKTASSNTSATFEQTGTITSSV